MCRILPFAVFLFVESNVVAANYFAAPGLWGIENPNFLTAKKADGRNSNKAGSGCGTKAGINEVKSASRKSTSDGKDRQDEVQYVNRYLSDELEEAEEAFYRAVEHVEKAVVHALDDEVETLFPHRKEEGAD